MKHTFLHLSILPKVIPSDNGWAAPKTAVWSSMAIVSDRLCLVWENVKGNWILYSTSLTCPNESWVLKTHLNKKNHRFSSSRPWICKPKASLFTFHTPVSCMSLPSPVTYLNATASKLKPISQMKCPKWLSVLCFNVIQWCHLSIFVVIC